VETVSLYNFFLIIGKHKKITNSQNFSEPVDTKKIKIITQTSLESLNTF